MDDRPLIPEEGSPLGILVSDTVQAAFGRRIEELARAHGVRVKCHALSLAREHAGSIRIAFFSRELYEGSTIAGPGPMSNAFFSIADNAPGLQWLHVFSSGLDLPQYARSLERGVRVTGSHGVTAEPIAQSTVAAILALSRGFGHWLSAQQRKQWAPLSGADRPRDLRGQRVIIAGTGAIGSEIARMLKCAGFHITGVRRRPDPLDPFDEVIAFDAMDETLPHCDWLVLALPLMPATRNLIDERRLALLAPHAFLANVARGPLVDERALVAALSAGKLAGAYLDTFIEEPLPASSPLWALPNVWITPHNCAASQGHEQRVIDAFFREYATWLKTCS